MLQLQSLRANLRKNGRAIHIKEPRICLFCNLNINISREHVLPGWVFEKTESFFITNINGLKRTTYNRTTIPACIFCNTAILRMLEKRINDLFSNHKLPEIFFANQELEGTIRWIEIIEYSFKCLYDGAGFLDKTHIQICIRNPNCIKGYFIPRKETDWP